MAQIITKIEAQKRKGRFNVYVDGQYAFPVSEDVFVKYRLFKGMELNQALIETLKDADRLSKLHAKALNYLAHQLRTEFEVRSKLQEFTEDEGAIDQVISQLKAQQLVNDQKYAGSYVRTVVRKKKNGPNWIRQKLLTKKVPKNLIEAALTDFFPEEQAIQNGRLVAQKQLRHYRNDSQKMMINKTKQLLIRRGFDSEMVTEIMAQIEIGNPTQHDEAIIQEVATKYWRKYRRLESYQQIQKTKQALFRKGFLMDDIESALAKLKEIN